MQSGSDFGRYQALSPGGQSIGLADAAAAVATAAGAMMGGSSSPQPAVSPRSQPVEKLPDIE
jgi:hypothetical protein